MPELPAMENFRRSIEENSLNKKVIKVVIKQDRVVRVDEKTLTAAAVDQKITQTSRHGKYVFIKIGSTAKTPWLAFHCGMTGYFTFLELVENESAIAKAKLVLQFADSSALAFYDPRRFGSVELIDNPEQFILEHDLGPDAGSISSTQFGESLQATKKPLKGFFLDQSAMAGIGNVYGDEIPFQARISPERSGKKISEVEASLLYKTMQKILKTAIDKKAYLDHWDMLPKTWLVHYREAGSACPRCGHAVSAYSAGGRDGYWCPGCQV